MQRNKISFSGQKIFVGIDVHKRKWSVATITESGFERVHTQNASAQELIDFLHRHYPDGDYVAVYEAGFTGFSTYYSLAEAGIECLVIHPADVPTTQYESVMKTDKVDCLKLAKSLRAGLLNGIYIRPKDSIDERGVVRIRRAIIKDLSRYKIRVKHLLMSNGVILPEQFDKRRGSCWSGAFIAWLKSDIKLLSSTRRSLDLLIAQVERMRLAQLQATRELRILSRTEAYRENYDLICSVPGIGGIVAMTLLTEVQDISRFSNERQFASYLGLVPTSHSSGDKTIHGEMTFRGNKDLGPMMIEAAWIAIRNDIGLASSFSQYCRKMKSQQAIVRVARKLSNIIIAVLKNKRKYVPYAING
jgi:transposase